VIHAHVTPEAAIIELTYDAVASRVVLEYRDAAERFDQTLGSATTRIADCDVDRAITIIEAAAAQVTFPVDFEGAFGRDGVRLVQLRPIPHDVRHRAWSAAKRNHARETASIVSCFGVNAFRVSGPVVGFGEAIANRHRSEALVVDVSPDEAVAGTRTFVKDFISSRRIVVTPDRAAQLVPPNGTQAVWSHPAIAERLTLDIPTAFILRKGAFALQHAAFQLPVDLETRSRYNAVYVDPEWRPREGARELTVACDGHLAAIWNGRPQPPSSSFAW
jgi:hypothetical protein